MKHLISLLTITLFLTACTSRPVYSPSTGNGFGYSHTQLDGNSYRVHFKMRGDDSQQAMDYAMRRAAQLTLEKGYDWFVINDQQTLTHTREKADPSITHSQTMVVTRDCGLIGCKTRSYPVHQTSFGTQLDSNQSMVESILAIRMGKGVRPNSDNSYDALEVHESILNQDS
ncbi:hypothetical protein [Kangiella sp.]|uniref:CC0125/CC1285 family lipoprotein n=1 Tax=Kangiella sp. TaxID=1920245 RepID=UPI00199D9844|nr:hypothetical protein [Kangiella sp.]MBD3654181.1 hypothetical protein [Kangiella sp.]